MKSAAAPAIATIAQAEVTEVHQCAGSNTEATKGDSPVLIVPPWAVDFVESATVEVQLPHFDRPAVVKRHSHAEFLAGKHSSTFA